MANKPTPQVAPTLERRADTTERRVEFTNHTAGQTLPLMKRLPAGVRPFVRVMPEGFKLPSLIVALTCMGVHMSRVRLRYIYDQRQHATVLQVIVKAPQSGSKSTIEYVQSRIMGRQRRRDKIFRREEQQWKETTAAPQLTQDGQPSPQKPPIRPVVTIGSTISRTMLAMRADAPERLYDAPLILFLFCEEVQEMVDNNHRDFAKLSTAFRKGYDLGATLDQDYVTSYSGTPDLLLSMLVMGTQGGVDAFMNDMEIEQGGLTRKILLTLPGELGDDAPQILNFTDDEERTIDATISLLMQQTYTHDGKSLQAEEQLDMAWLDKTVERWCENIRQEVKVTGSLATDTFYKRASVSAFRLTAILSKLYLIDPARPDNWQQQCRRAYRFLAGFILDGLLREWGGRYEAVVTKQAKERKELIPSAYGLCPDEFSREWFFAMVKEQGYSKEPRKFLFDWKKRGMITERDENGTILYRKTEKGRQAHERLTNGKGGAA